MSEELQLQLQTSSILDVPIQNYEEDFTFIVNGETFKTSQLISDLLSPTISSQHRTDPTNKTIVINTKSLGDFSRFLNLVTFKPVTIPTNDIPFLIEIFSILKPSNIKMINNKDLTITEDNVIELLQKHETQEYFYSNNIDEEIEYISLHFYKLCESQRAKLKNMKEDTINKIISNNKLHLKDENQLLHFLNEIYEERKDIKTRNLYEFVIFENVYEDMIEEFLSVYDYNDLTHETWISITNRLKQPIQRSKKETTTTLTTTRYEKQMKSILNENQGQTFSPGNSNSFDGIINFLKKQSNGNIENKINITTSSLYKPYPPINTTNYEDSKKWFSIYSPQSSNWLCFEFKENQIIPTNYQIKSIPYGPNSNHLKTWILEGSNDSFNWSKLDEQSDNSNLNGNCNTHIFTISNPSSQKFKFIRLRLNGPDWAGQNYLMLDSIEFYGKLI